MRLQTQNKGWHPKIEEKLIFSAWEMCSNLNPLRVELPLSGAKAIEMTNLEKNSSHLTNQHLNKSFQQPHQEFHPVFIFRGGETFQ